ncbi:unnamed protein product [Brassicogethes aeneus]|uniref:THAP-type domain-containing protein n=1 Tax=Brassicogethes aeneus TaxID=1431903 RepID=A0A9P0FRH1_BRAAE|nr:unnamed protein product [Brassicogethes aeneus]
MSKKCIVSSCGQLTNRYVLPKNEGQASIWLQRSGNREMEKKKQKNATICPRHFSNQCFLEYGLKGLKKGALPSLFLPDYTSTGVEGDNFFFVKRESPTRTHIPGILKALEMPALPSTTGEFSPVAKVKTPTKTYGKRITDTQPKRLKPMFEDEEPIENIIEESDKHQPSTSQEGLSYIKFDKHRPSTSQEELSYIESDKQRPSTSQEELSYIESDKQRPSISQKGTRAQPSLHSTNITRKKNQLKNKSMAVRRTTVQLQKFDTPNIGTSNLISLIEQNRDFLETVTTSNDVSLNFFASNMRNLQCKPKGRRFSLKDNIFALSLYKHSPRAYRFLSKFFSLPSRKTLTNMLNKVPFLAGINPAIFKHLKTSVAKLIAEDRNCIAMVDEMAVQPHLQHNERYDYIEGFVDLGGGNRRIQFADHALVFMAKGIRKAWKQPVFFGFCEGTTATDDLVKCITDVIKELELAGLTVVATVSDQGATNRAAINKLCNKKTGEALLYHPTGEKGAEIVHLFDPPHLLKGIRNGLLTKDLKFKVGEDEKVASWEHILNYYVLDRKQGAYVHCTKLTDEHVLPNKIRKMKVKMASQVFSHTLGCDMHQRARITKRLNLPPSDPDFLNPQAMDTADLILFLDKLFDSVNGLKRRPPPGKPLLSVVTETSDHLSFWTSAISTLRSMFFVSDSTSKSKSTSSYPSIKNWISTLHGFVYVREKVLKLFDFFSPRSFNQDPLENFFGQIRSHAVGNTTCSSFIHSFKSLLVSRFSSSHSVGSNCEEDLSEGPLSTLKRFVLQQENVPVSEGAIERTPVKEALATDFATDYVAGAILKKFFRRFSCDACYKYLSSAQPLPEHLQVRQFEGHNLINPDYLFSYTLNNTTIFILEILPSIIHKYGIKKIILTELQNQHFQFLLCDEHIHLKHDDLFKVIINVVLFDYIKLLNRVLRGIDLRLIDSNDLFRKAHEKFLKRIPKSKRRRQEVYQRSS